MQNGHENEGEKIAVCSLVIGLTPIPYFLCVFFLHSKWTTQTLAAVSAEASEIGGSYGSSQEDRSSDIPWHVSTAEKVLQGHFDERPR